jgi:predicted acetyltransferase
MILKVRDNIFMRTLSADDAPEVYDVIDNNRLYLRKWLPWVDTTDSAAVVRDVIDDWERRRENGSDIVCGIFTEGGYIGNIGLHDIDMNTKKAVIGYWLAEAFQGGGIMTDCVRALTAYAFELRVNTVAIHCAAGNKKSRALPLRLGFTESGIKKDGENLYGITHDSVIYSLDRLRLVFPTTGMEREALDYRREHFDCGEREIHGDGGLDHAESYLEWIDKINADLTRQEDTYVPATTFFAVAGDKIVGTIQIRHCLNDYLLGYGGHIGYGVRPSRRRLGYATEMLRLALAKCRELGIERALVTCDNDNIGSMRVILKNGGVLENEVSQKDDILLQRYWINTTKS